jgi:hypothetical protein
MKTNKVVDSLLKYCNNYEKETKILWMLSGHEFEKWYEKDFMDYISGEENAKTEEQILEDIKQLLS